MSLIKQTSIAVISSVFALSFLVATPVNAEINPFASQVLMTHASMDDKAEGKCGEGKCGEGKAETKAKGKCGEGKCGEGKAEAKGKCGEGKAETKAKGKCGEGKCGEGKAKAQDKKCGG